MEKQDPILIYNKYKHLGLSKPECYGQIAANITTSDTVSRDGEDKSRCSITSFYYLLIGESHSCFHKINSDEIVHFYAGDAAYIHTIDENGTLKTQILGDPLQTPGASF